MTTAYHSGRGLAITCGLAATGGALAILLADPITSGNWRLDHFLLPLIVSITIASGHLFGAALRGWRILPAIGFALNFAVGTALTVYSSVGAQKSGAGARQEAAASFHNGAIADKRAELARARLRFAEAEAMADKEMTGERCARRCDDWKLRAKEVAARIDQIEGELQRLGAVEVAPSRARPFAEALAVLGFDEAKVEKIVATFEPFAFSLLFELAAIVAFGYGLGHRREQWQAKAPASQPATMPKPGPSGGTRKGKPVALNHVATKAAAEADVIQLVARGQKLPSQEVLATRWGVHKGTTSKWLSDFEGRGIISRQREGHRKMVAAA